MSKFIESLKRLYDGQRLTIEKLDELLNSSKINNEEYAFIKGE